MMTPPPVEEGSPQWMAWLTDRVCPLCGGGIAEVHQLSCRCAGATPCGHKVLKGDRAAARIRDLWAAAE